VWKEYNIFENVSFAKCEYYTMSMCNIIIQKEVDETLAKKLTEEYLRQYTTMKRCSKEYDQFSRQLNKHAPAIPPQGTVQEHAQVIM